MLFRRNHFKYKDTYRLKGKGNRKIFHVNTNQKKAGIATPIPNRTDCRTSEVIRNKIGRAHV